MIFCLKNNIILMRKSFSINQFKILKLASKFYPREVFDKNKEFKNEDIEGLEKMGYITSKKIANVIAYKLTEEGKRLYEKLAKLYESGVAIAFTKRSVKKGLETEKIYKKFERIGIESNLSQLESLLEELVELNIFEKYKNKYKPRDKFRKLILEFKEEWIKSSF